MFYDTSSRQVSQPRLWNHLALALTPWRMLAGVVKARRTRAQLSSLPDYMLKDIGLSRGSIESAIRNGRSRDYP